MLGVLNQIKRRLRLIGVSIVLLLGGFSSSQEQELTVEERFSLFNNCMPMDVVVEGLSDDAVELGLTENSLISAVESRLRSARLYDKDASNYLYLNVSVVSPAFSIRLAYEKRLFDPVSGEFWMVETWVISGTGTHSESSTFIRSSVSEYMDEFLVDYLRINEDHC